MKWIVELSWITIVWTHFVMSAILGLSAYTAMMVNCIWHRLNDKEKEAAE